MIRKRIGLVALMMLVAVSYAISAEQQDLTDSDAITLCELVELVRHGWPSMQEDLQSRATVEQVVLGDIGPILVGTDRCRRDSISYRCSQRYDTERARDLSYAELLDELESCVSISDVWAGEEMHSMTCTSGPDGEAMLLDKSDTSGLAYIASVQSGETMMLHRHDNNDPTSLQLNKQNRLLRGGFNPNPQPHSYDNEIAVTWIPRWDMDSEDCEHKLKALEEQRLLMEEMKRRRNERAE